MPLFLCVWKIFPDKKSDAYVLFSSMDEAAHQASLGEGCTQLGRWHNPSAGTGVALHEAVNAEAMYSYLWKWAESMMTVEAFVVADDNKCREIVLGQPPSWIQSYEHVNDLPNEGESLYLGHWKYESCQLNADGNKYFANMTQEEHEADVGSSSVRFIGRWHMMTEGKGYVVAAAKDPMDVVRWAYKWAPMVRITIEPVLHDVQAADIVKKNDGYEVKLAAVMEKLGLS